MAHKELKFIVAEEEKNRLDSNVSDERVNNTAKIVIIFFVVRAWLELSRVCEIKIIFFFTTLRIPVLRRPRSTKGRKRRRVITE